MAALLLCAAVVPGLQDGYPTLFHAQANLLFSAGGGLGGDRAVRFSWPDPVAERATSGARHGGSGASDTRMVGYDRTHVDPRRFEAEYRIAPRGFWPLALVGALMLATPLPWGRRWALVLLSGVVVSCFTLAQAGLLAFTSFGLADHGGADWERAARVAQSLFNSERPPLLVAVLVWAVAARPGRYLDARSVLSRRRA